MISDTQTVYLQIHKKRDSKIGLGKCVTKCPTVLESCLIWCISLVCIIWPKEAMPTTHCDGDVTCVNILPSSSLAIQNSIWKSHQIGISSFCTSNQGRRLLHSYLISSSNLALRRAQTGRSRFNESGAPAPNSYANFAQAVMKPSRTLFSH